MTSEAEGTACGVKGVTLENCHVLFKLVESRLQEQGNFPLL